MLANQGANYLATGEPPGRLGNDHPNIAPYQVFRTADGSLILACGNDNLFRKFCEVGSCAHLPRTRASPPTASALRTGSS